MILEAKNLTFKYKNSDRYIVKDFNMKVDSHSRLGIVAPSGFGKTTLCKLISGYEKPLAGDVILDGKSILNVKGYNQVQMIWQHPEQALNPRLMMKNVLAEGDNIDKSVIRALGIKDEWLNRFPQELSGGELQRFCIARALGQRTKFLLADEITTMLDMINQSDIWHFLMDETKKRGIGMVIVSHSQSLLDKVCTEILEL